MGEEGDETIHLRTQSGWNKDIHKGFVRVFSENQNSIKTRIRDVPLDFFIIRNLLMLNGF